MAVAGLVLALVRAPGRRRLVMLAALLLCVQRRDRFQSLVA